MSTTHKLLKTLAQFITRFALLGAHQTQIVRTSSNIFTHYLDCLLTKSSNESFVLFFHFTLCMKIAAYSKYALNTVDLYPLKGSLFHNRPVTDEKIGVRELNEFFPLKCTDNVFQFLAERLPIFRKKRSAVALFQCLVVVPSKGSWGWNTAKLPKPRQGKSRGRGRVRTTDLPTQQTAQGIHICKVIKRNSHSQSSVDHPQLPTPKLLKTIHSGLPNLVGNEKLFTRLLKILQQPTTGFALLGAHQVGAFPEFPSNLMFYLNPNCTVFDKYTNLQISFSRDSTESPVYDMRRPECSIFS
ncbi:hypothetical protein T265_10565 [Opisthorchis viverrini]|uniref:Uncharacterized protein n=1 Tax=Opisthorchis viverrini TaxID=6198 RepID=A0A075A0S7_OPIVI|nr:hypothetical protein T265_10565 [Opisthorchis viverrini]KER21014.1 hypothetical protein T265_10565 [Opisthorchis viverrini]